jgi:hypothetical protein
MPLENDDIAAYRLSQSGKRRSISAAFDSSAGERNPRSRPTRCRYSGAVRCV